jgi:hypothetical protein
MLWEYRSINILAEGFFNHTFDLNAFTTRCNELGAQGWELVNLFGTNLGPAGTSNRVVAMFKRPKT